VALLAHPFAAAELQRRMRNGDQSSTTDLLRLAQWARLGPKSAVECHQPGCKHWAKRSRVQFTGWYRSISSMSRLPRPGTFDCPFSVAVLPEGVSGPRGCRAAQKSAENDVGARIRTVIIEYSPGETKVMNKGGRVEQL
jgi:hypothetical protein